MPATQEIGSYQKELVTSLLEVCKLVKDHVKKVQRKQQKNYITTALGDVLGTALDSISGSIFLV